MLVPSLYLQGRKATPANLLFKRKKKKKNQEIVRFLFPTIICVLIQLCLGCEDGCQKQGPLRASGHSSGLTRAQSNSQQQTQGPHLELSEHCQIRQLNPILGIHIQNPSPKYQFSASADVCHHLSDSGQTAVASLPTAPSTCALSTLGSFCHPLPCSPHTKILKAFSGSEKHMYSLQLPTHPICVPWKGSCPCWMVQRILSAAGTCW